jgi:hypothetical protein
MARRNRFAPVPDNSIIVLSPILDANPISPNVPSFLKILSTEDNTSVGLYSYCFSNVRREDLMFSINLPNGVNMTIEPKVQLYYSTKAGTPNSSGQVKFEIEYVFPNFGDTIQNSTVISAEKYISSDQQNAKTELTFPQIEGVYMSGNSVFLLRLSRIVAGVTDNFPTRISLLNLQLKILDK